MQTQRRLPRLLRIKSWILPFHRWSGLTIGLVLLFSAATGASIAFKPQLEPILEARLLRVPHSEGHASIEEMGQKVLQAAPGSSLDVIEIEPHVAGTILDATTWIRTTDDQRYFFDPHTGDYMGEMNRYGGILGMMLKLHRFRFMSNGNWITTPVLFVTIFVLVLGGVVLWSPLNRKGLKPALQLNMSLKKRPRLLNIHRVFGIYAGLVLLSSAATALVQSYEPAEHFVYQITDSPLPAKATKSTVPLGHIKTVSFDDHLTTIMSLAGAVPEKIRIIYPEGGADAVNGYYISSGAPHKNARSLFSLDAYDGSVLVHTPYADSTTGHKLYNWLVSWHEGSVFGFATQVLVFLGSICTLVLGYTGIRSFWIKSLMRRVK